MHIHTLSLLKPWCSWDSWAGETSVDTLWTQGHRWQWETWWIIVLLFQLAHLSITSNSAEKHLKITAWSSQVMLNICHSSEFYQQTHSHLWLSTIKIIFFLQYVSRLLFWDIIITKYQRAATNYCLCVPYKWHYKCSKCSQQPKQLAASNVLIYDTRLYLRNSFFLLWF